MSDIIAAAPTVPIDPWVAFMERAVRDPNFDTAKLGALLEMRHREMEQQRIERAEERKRIFSEALTAFQAEVDPVVRDAINPFLKNKYASLKAAVTTAQPYMGKHHLNVRYVSESAPPGWLKMGIIIGHDCGYEDPPFMLSMQTTDTGSKGGRLPMTPGQAVAATATFLRRQLFTIGLNLVAGEIEPDDDGEMGKRLPTDRQDGPTRRDPPPGYQREEGEAPPLVRRTDDAWRIWLTKLRFACSGLSIAGVVEVGGRQSVRDAIERGPKWVRIETNQILGEAMDAAQAKEDDEAEAEEPFPEGPPGDAEDGAPAIEGEDKAAG